MKIRLLDFLPRVRAVAFLQAGGGGGIDALAWLDDIHQDQPNDHRDGRDHRAVGERLQPDAPELAHVTQPGHAHDQRREHQRDDRHQQYAQEELPHRFRDIGENPKHRRVLAAKDAIDPHARHDANGQPDEDARVQRHAPDGSPGARAG